MSHSIRTQRRVPFLRRLAATFCLLAALPAQARDILPGIVLWPEPAQDPRELSGIEISADGRELWAVSDRGYLLHATISRTADGEIAAISAPTTLRLTAPGGTGPGDAEGIAILGDGRLAISFENPHVVAIYDRGGAHLQTLPSPDFFSAFPGEHGPEGVAATRDGAILVVMEGIPQGAARIPLYRYAGGRWGQIDGPMIDGRYQPVGLDTDAEGRIYLLEREYRRPAAFSTRLRRLTVTGNGVHEEILLQTASGAYGNFEGVSIWRGADGGLRATLVADDQGMRMLQRGLAEFRIPD